MILTYYEHTMIRSANVFSRNHPNKRLLINLQTTKTLFLIKKKRLKGATGGVFIIKRLQHRCFPANIFKSTYFEEHLHTATSEVTLGSDCLGLSF